MPHHEQLTFLGIRPPVERRSAALSAQTPPRLEERRKFPDSYLEDHLIALVDSLHVKHLPPLAEAQKYWELTQRPYGFTPSRLAKVAGKDVLHVTESLSFMTWPAQTREILARTTLSHGHLYQLKRLANLAEVIPLAAEAEKAHWTVDALKDRVSNLLGLHDKTQAEAERKLVTSLLLDPLARELRQGDFDPISTLWPRLLSDASLQHVAAWTVQYRGNLKWGLEVKAATADPAASRLKLAEWFRKMADALEGNR